MALSRSITEPKALGINTDIDATYKIYAFEAQLLEENPGNLYDSDHAQRRLGEMKKKGIGEDTCI